MLIWMKKENYTTTVIWYVSKALNGGQVRCWRLTSLNITQMISDKRRTFNVFNYSTPVPTINGVLRERKYLH